MVSPPTTAPPPVPFPPPIGVPEPVKVPKSDWPYLPSLPKECPKCGITLNKVISYSCPQVQCPTGLGPITS